MDFLLAAELGRVLLFSWEELELFSSSSSSSSSKLMLLEMPGPGRGAGGDEWSHIHTQADTVHRHGVTHTAVHTHAQSHMCTRALPRTPTHVSRYIYTHSGACWDWS